MVNDWTTIDANNLPEYDQEVLLQFDETAYPEKPIVIGKRVKTSSEGETYELQFQTLEPRVDAIAFQALVPPVV